MRPITVCILAAGKGKRMGNADLAKVLTPLATRPLLGYVLETAAELNPELLVVVAGHQHESVRAFVHARAPFATIVLQEQQLGTGHAVAQARTVLESSNSDVLILSGDVPLLTADTLHALLAHHRSTEAVLTVLTTIVSNPSGYGRMIRNKAGALVGIVEHKDATAEQLTINEINSGIYLVRSDELFPALLGLENTNAQGEFYLTDIAGILMSEGKRIEAMATPNATEVHGINTPDDLAVAAQILAERVTS